MNPMDKYRQANRKMWDEFAVINSKSAFYNVDEFKRGRTSLDAADPFRDGGGYGTNPCCTCSATSGWIRFPGQADGGKGNRHGFLARGHPHCPRTG